MAVHPYARTEAPDGGPRARVGGASPDVLQELLVTAARFRALVERIPAVTYTAIDDSASPTGSRITYVSPQVERVLGYTAEEFLADPGLWERITHPEDRERLLSEERRVGETREPFRMEYRMFARDGSLRWFRDEATLVESEEAGLTFWQGFMLDVTEEREARERRQEAELLYRSLVETLPAVVFVDRMDHLASNVYTGPQTTEMLGYTPEEWQTDPNLWLEKLVHPEDRERLIDAQRRHLEEGGRFDEEYRALTKDGRELWVRDIADEVRAEDGTALYSQGFLFDITARKEAEVKLQEALARERDAAEQLRELDELKGTLLHTLSHDLQSPLAAIVGAVATLTRPELDLPAELHRDLLEGIAKRARRMSRLLRDLLDLDRLDQGIVEPNRVHVDVGKLVADTARGCDALESRFVEIGTADVPGFIDPSKVERIVENLLVNAARHTPKGTRISARAERLGDGVLLVVEDEGPGVPDEAKEEIFERFRRGPDASGTPGTGVGLSLVARFAALHGGRAWVEDRPGGGASFRVFLPDLPGKASDATEPLGDGSAPS